MYSPYNYNYVNPSYGYDAFSKPSQAQPTNQSVVFIQGGEFAASNYLLAPNQSVIMIDNEQGKLFIKTTDASGSPISFRKFTEERPVQPQNQQVDFVTRDEFEKRLAEIVNNAKSSVPAA